MNSENTVTILMAVVVGTVIGHHADDIVEKNYPPISSQSKKHHIELEYKIISGCINADRRIISHRRYQRKEKICICAFKKLEFSNSSYYELEQKEFLTSFSKYVNVCQNK